MGAALALLTISLSLNTIWLVIGRAASPVGAYLHRLSGMDGLVSKTQILPLSSFL